MRDGGDGGVASPLVRGVFAGEGERGVGDDEGEEGVREGDSVCEWERVVCLFVRVLLFRILELLQRILAVLFREIKCRQAECAKHPK